jgi:hypothetical protein
MNKNVYIKVENATLLIRNTNEIQVNVNNVYHVVLSLNILASLSKFTRGYALKAVSSEREREREGGRGRNGMQMHYN